MNENISVRDIMTTKFVAFSPETPLLDATKALLDKELHGAPVVDKDGKLLGILTEYDLISKESFVHLPTLQIVLQNIRPDMNDKKDFEKHFEKIANVTVKDVMNSDPLTLPETASFDDTVEAFREHHRVNPIPVVDASKKVVGVVSRFDLLKPLGK